MDGGVYVTANIDIAIEKGADLIVCYNPFAVPIQNSAEEGYLSDQGLKTVLGGVSHDAPCRLRLGLQR